MHGGQIYKNLSGDAGGVFIALGTVYMYDGKIIENRGTWSAGGVMNQGFFYMYGGEISRNYGGLGGGVGNFTAPVLGLGGWFHMWGGKISGNTGDGSGGGVVNDAWFYMHGGEISGNRTNMGMGGGVYTGNPAYEDDGVFVMTGGVVYGRDKPTNWDASLGAWETYANKDNGGGSQGGAFHVLGGIVAWGRRGYYDLDENDAIRYTPDTRYEDCLADPDEDVRGKQFFPDISIGQPHIKTSSDTEPEYIYIADGTLIMKQDFARIISKKQGGSNETIEVVPVAGTSKVTGDPVGPGVYIEGDATVDFTDDPEDW
jgi:hypothetical protein